MMTISYTNIYEVLSSQICKLSERESNDIENLKNDLSNSYSDLADYTTIELEKLRHEFNVKLIPLKSIIAGLITFDIVVIIYMVLGIQ